MTRRFGAIENPAMSPPKNKTFTPRTPCLFRCIRKGFGAGVYFRSVYEPNEIDTNLIQTKFRVTPLRQLLIPRLELQGALTVIQDLGFQRNSTRTIYWCDPKTVLQWIQSKTCRYHAFVTNRITEILDTLTAEQWSSSVELCNTYLESSILQTIVPAEFRLCLLQFITVGLKGPDSFRYRKRCGRRL